PLCIVMLALKSQPQTACWQLSFGYSRACLCPQEVHKRRQGRIDAVCRKTNLLYLDFELFADRCLERWKFRFQTVMARRDRRERVGARSRRYYVACGVGIDIGECNGRSRYDGTGRICYTSCNFTECLSIQTAH